jgi:putative FmdB family regulatory protein
VPLYEYKCESCGMASEHQQRISDEPLRDCAACGIEGTLVRLIGATSFVLRGSGWAKDNYASTTKKP